MRFRILIAALVVLAAWPCGASAADPSVAALQVALRVKNLYAGPVDGVVGPATERAVRLLQRRARLTVDGVPGPATRAALGPFARHRLGSRELRVGAAGWDVAALQFLLANRGFPSGPLDGSFGERTEAAVRRYQRWARLTEDGRVGASTLAALARGPARADARLAHPLAFAPTDGFGPRGGGFHTGLDYPAPAGTPVGAAASGRVTYAGWHDGGWGYLVTIAHGGGLRTMYAHLSQIDVRIGQRIAVGARVGAVGSSGHSTGAHLHFEVRVRGAAVDPTALLP